MRDPVICGMVLTLPCPAHPSPRTLVHTYILTYNILTYSRITFFTSTTNVPKLYNSHSCIICSLAFWCRFYSFLGKWMNNHDLLPKLPRQKVRNWVLRQERWIFLVQSPYFQLRWYAQRWYFKVRAHWYQGGGVWPTFVTVKINGSRLDTLGPPGVANIYLFATRQSAKTRNFSGK